MDPLLRLMQCSRAAQLGVLSQDVKRRERWQLIVEPFSQLLCGREPPTSVPVNTLIILGNTLKEEGNLLFSEKEYVAAVELYTAGIVLYEGLLSRHNYNTVVNQQRAAIFLANRAICFLKLGGLYECIEDCDAAIGLSPQYVKAYYRKALALKDLGLYENARSVAERGLGIAKGPEIAEYKALLDDIEKDIAWFQSVSSSASSNRSCVSSQKNTVQLGQSDNSKTLKPGSRIKAAEKVVKKGVKQKKVVDVEKTIPPQTKKKRTRKKKSKKVKNVVLEVSSDSDSSTEDEKITKPDKLESIHASSTKFALLADLAGDYADIEGAVSSKRSAKQKSSGAVKPENTSSKTMKSLTTSSGAIKPENTSSKEVKLVTTSSGAIKPENTSSKEVKLVTTSSGAIKPGNTSSKEVKSVTTSSENSGKSNSTNWSSVSNSGDASRNSNGSKPTPEESSARKGVINDETFPLHMLYNCFLACNNCYRDNKLNSHVVHECSKNVLIVQNKRNSQLFKVRERTNHALFFGKYKRCQNLISGTDHCPRGGYCSFAHSDPEMIIWTKEKDGEFSIEEFINRHGSRQGGAGQNPLQSFFVKFPGYLLFVCRLCFTTDNRLVEQSSVDITVCGYKRHPWNTSAILAHRASSAGGLTLIGQRPSNVEIKYYGQCPALQYCPKKWTNECTKAHSVLELQLWYVERCLNMTHEQLIIEAQKFSKDCPSTLTARYPSRSSSLSVSDSRSSLSQSHVANAGEKKCPFPIISVCSACWKLSKRVERKSSPSATRCVLGHAWNDSTAIFLIMPAKEVLRPLPPRYPRDLSFSVCWNIINWKKCDRITCFFAHSEEEVKVWKWMAKNKVGELTDILKSSSSPAVVSESTLRPRVTAAAPPPVKPAAWSVATTSTAVTSLFDMAPETYICMYCNVSCNSENQFIEHNTSSRHKLNVNSDKERDWNCRPPPQDVIGGKYSLCERHKEQRCRYSGVDDIGSDSKNFCRFAHSADELDEWNERYRWREMKKKRAKEQNLYSYMDLLIDDLESATNTSTVISEVVDGILVECSTELLFYDVNKDATRSWKFCIKTSGQPLVKVALLYDEYRHHFVIESRANPNCQMIDGSTRKTSANEYCVNVNFNGGLFGVFMQTVVFDFDSRPVIIRKLKVELGDRTNLAKVIDLHNKLHFDRWTTDNRQIVLCPDLIAVNEQHKRILGQYKTPSDFHSVVNQKIFKGAFCSDNYKSRMHNLLYLEELTQAKIISTLNIKSTLKLTRSIQEESGSMYAQGGELYVRVSLEDQLNEDSKAGHLVLWSVNSVLLSFEIDVKSGRIYEVSIVEYSDNYTHHKCYGKDYVYLRIPPRCCQDLGLKCDAEYTLEIQFQMNRLVFCQMHLAVDKLNSVDLLFPKPIAPKSVPQFDLSSVSLSTNLNEDQKWIVKHVMTERERWVAPLVVFGAFGTGKTETLVQATMALLSHGSSGIRILICTHTNTAADEYILRHLDKFFSSSPGGSVDCKGLLRVFDVDRRIATVDPVVRKYCLLSEDSNRFLAPTRSDIMRHGVVITTLVTSLVLSELDSKGCFTHIFIDEAAQVHECQVIMPMSMATEKTCVVLAGDHLQMGQKVYSEVARDLKFDLSIVERLYNYYGKVSTEGCPLPRLLLKTNYRNHPEILRFLSSVFYGGPEVLVSKCKEEVAGSLLPLNFYVACGQETQDNNGTSWYNLAEIHEVVERVNELYQSWPEAWGEKDARAILVTTAYTDQEKKLRSALRQRKLGAVTVLRVHNLPGKEFRAVFVSTVRSRHIRSISDKEGEFGFLSEEKLLNTALTRAKSWLGVVGDPVALCSVGECSKIWKKYLKHCEKLGGILPKGFKLEDVWMQVRQNTSTVLPAVASDVGLQNGTSYSSTISTLPSGDPGVYNQSQAVNKAAQVLSASRRYQDHKPASETEREHGGSSETVLPYCTEGQNRSVMNLYAGETSGISGKPRDAIANSAAHPKSSKGKKEQDFLSFEEWSLDYQMEPDEIISQLAKGINHAKEAEAASIRATAERTRPQKEYGGVSKWVRSDSSRRSRNLISDVDFDDDEHGEDGDQTPTDKCKYTKDQLIDFITSEPTVHKRCIAHIDCVASMHARPIDKSFSRILLGSRKRCGQAFHGDEVVVKIVKLKGSSENVLKANRSVLSLVTVNKSGLSQADIDFGMPIGEVVGILKRAVEPRYRSFVCQVEIGNESLMVPLSRGVPKLSTHKREETAPGSVAVFRFTKTKHIIFDEHWDVTKNTESLFVVRYLKWDEGYSHPLGVVVGVLPAGVTIEQAMRILSIEHHIPRKFKADTLDEVKTLLSERKSGALPLKSLKGREDYRNKLVFTIDPPHSRDLDDALSLEGLLGEGFLVGIHIADVAQFVPKGGSIDSEAKARGSSFYATGEPPTPMLPPRLSEDLCSLLPGCDRLTLSVFFKLDKEFNVIDVEIKRCVICSKFKLSYSDAESIITSNDNQVREINNSNSWPLKLISDIKCLHLISKTWRRKRLGSAALYNQPNLSRMDSPKAHDLVEEMMIAANNRVALRMKSAMPGLAVLRSQVPPGEAELTQWRTRFVEAVRNSVAFNRLFHDGLEACQCPGNCVCLPPLNVLEQSVDVSILPSTWYDIRHAVDDGDSSRVEQLVLSPEYHPDLAVAASYLVSIQERSSYVCCGSTSDESEESHYSLNLSAYTHFTSPIRRYIDLVVHRLVGSIIEGAGSTSVNYSSSELAELCAQCADASSRSRRFEQATEVVKLCDLIRRRPIVADAFIYSVTDGDIQLLFPILQKYFPSRIKIELRSLNTKGRPNFDAASHQLVLQWSQRIYDLSKDKKRPLSGDCETVRLNADCHVVKVKPRAWRAMVQAVNKENTTETKDAVFDVVKTLRSDEPQIELTSEGVILRRNKHFCEYSIALHPAGVVRIQLSTELYRGLLRPCAQLFHLTQTNCICIEHVNKPVECFSEVASKRAALDRYKSLNAYTKLWLPVLSMEAAHGAVNNALSAVIHNVPIEWREHTVRGAESMYTGTLQISIAFCDERCIRFSVEGEPEDEVNTKLSDLNSRSSIGYMCVRYPDVTLPVPNMDIPFDRIINMNEKLTWVGHCLVSRVSQSKDKLNFNVYLLLHKCNFPFPRNFCGASPQCATVEWISKSLPDRRMEQALLHISGGLAACIAKGTSFTGDDSSLEPGYILTARHFATYELPGLSPANEVQLEAVEHSMTTPFSLIQGPPGTGKTVTAVRLASLFARLNMTLPSSSTGVRPQVMICGPSNKAVDVVAAYLKRISGQSIHLVRVYSLTKEHEDFPVPGHLVAFKKRSKLADRRRDENLKDISLHHMVREGDSSEAQFIREMDILIRDYMRQLSDEGSSNLSPLYDGPKYLGMIAKREKEILNGASILLCTCSTSGALRLRDPSMTNVQQVIIDECAMCKEPESLVPIVSTHAPQVILVGDHKQLQPIILEKRAQKLGLGRSLFERYAKNAKMLTKQYRMHPAIMAFPSEQFYGGRLVIGRLEQEAPSTLNIWPAGVNKPIAFVNVIGFEETLTVATEEGSERSKSNPQELEKVLSTVHKMVRSCGVPASSIAVLSQYRAQTFQATERLRQNYADVTVSTVVAAQGSEWDYVILSTVRSLPPADIEENPSLMWRVKNLGFITDEHQINVAVTRAKKGLIIIGNRALLACDPVWYKLIEHYETNGAIVEACDF